MKRLPALAIMATMLSCGTPKASLCGSGDELRADGTSACLYSAALIEEGFLCPPERSVRTDLDDGSVVCSEEAVLPEGIAEQLEAQGYDRPTRGTSWSFDDDEPTGVDNPPAEAEHWVLGTLLDLDVDEPLEKARICIMDADPETCTMSDMLGQFALPVASETEYALTAEHDGYYPTILPLVPLSAEVPSGSPNLRLTGWGMTSVAKETDLLTSVGVTHDPTRGLLSLAIEGQGVVATVSPGTDEGWYPEGATLIRSTNGTTGEYGQVRFPNLAPGEYTVSATSDDLSCFADGWQGATEDTIRIPVRAGFMTSPLTIKCR